MTSDIVPSFTPVKYTAGYLPISAHGLIGDGTTAALIGRDGAAVWLCIPRFHSPPLFCRILDASKGEYFAVAPEGLVESRQYYHPHTGVLVTEMRSHTGTVRLTDALTLRSGIDLSEDTSAGHSELLRLVEILHGQVRPCIEMLPHKGGHPKPHVGGLSILYPSRPGIAL